ncbi:MAG: response regulator [Alphaproteobacteria bacterium]
MTTILIIEDAESVRSMLTMRLKRAGYQVESAENGKVGVERALGLRPEVVLMDLHMPVMDGHEAVRLLRTQGYDGLIVAVTASAMIDETSRSTGRDCDAFIAKPIGKDFEERIAGLLARRK